MVVMITRSYTLHGYVKVQMFLLAVQASRLDLGIASSVSLFGRLTATAADTAIVAANG